MLSIFSVSYSTFSFFLASGDRSSKKELESGESPILSNSILGLSDDYPIAYSTGGTFYDSSYLRLSIFVNII